MDQMQLFFPLLHDLPTYEVSDPATPKTFFSPERSQASLASRCYTAFNLLDCSLMHTKYYSRTMAFFITGMFWLLDFLPSSCENVYEDFSSSVVFPVLQQPLG